MSHYKTKKTGVNFLNEDIIFTFVYVKNSQKESKIIHLWKAPGRLVYKKKTILLMSHTEAQHGAVFPSSEMLSAAPSFSEVRTQEKGLSFKVRFALLEEDVQICKTPLSGKESASSQAFFLCGDSFIEHTFAECVLCAKL